MLYVTGDTHGRIDRFTIKNFPEQQTLTKDDYVLVCGDFGLIWDNSAIELSLRKQLSERRFTTLFALGNHENYDIIRNEFPLIDYLGGKARKITESIICLENGEVYTINDKKIFVMGGAYSIDKCNRKEHISWWKEEIPTYKEFENGFKNLDLNNWKVDYVFTHTCPESILVKDSIYEVDNTVEKYLEEISSNIDFKEWYFGHHHIDKEFGKFNCIYNKIKKVF